MDAKVFWNVFVDTGAPEAYLSYRDALLTEANHVPDNQSVGPAGHGLQ